MQTVKGLIALFITAGIIFAAGAWDDIRSQDRYAARLLHPPPISRHLVAGTLTNRIDQARQKIKNTSL